MLKPSRNLTFAVAALVGVMLLAGAVYAQQVLPKQTNAPDFNLTDLEGKQFKLSENKGKVVYINFWATWCPPCRDEFPALVKLQQKYANNKNVVILSLSLDDLRTAGRVKPFVESHKAKHRIFVGSGVDKAARDYKVEAIPTNYLVGKDGKIADSWVGFDSEEDPKKWETAIEAALKR